MKARTFWRTVVSDRSDFLGRIVSLLENHGIRYCVIGGQAVNASAEPVVSLDLDIAIAPDQIERAEALLAPLFRVEEFEHWLNVSAPCSDLRVQIQTDPRYATFVERASPRDVLGITLPVADVTDVLQGKAWAASDPTRRPSKRLKDVADIARLLESRPDLVHRVPPEIRDRLA
jgi:hypothetical protein